ncbi:MAG: hypothetical protein A2Z97_01950 [Bdellovibrionales bacterium GWB1_52_6]|nr:MAG: hypothetical protein A2Z97_01950 [Bdellovibrionales bacterium GWB1_52_6]OFZ04538.1 MAG: hypothetical protein A2X97_13005 [Bdellovibrionales bacterium GWA1_52_35]HCM39944.1 peptidoglycan editing factor PgeF [Bdellovibrionales bacterium]
MKTIQSQLLLQVPGIRHGFGTLEEPIPAGLQGAWGAKASLRQVHGAGIIELNYPGQNAESADGFFTRQVEIPTAIMTADCVPVLLARKDGKAVAAVHAGWRGTRARILRNLWDKLAAQHESPADWIAAVGPAIGSCCYNVSKELAEDFSREFKFYDHQFFLPRPLYLDLPQLNALELKSIGISQVEVLPLCTYCSQDSGGPLFNSYRRNPTEAGRQYSGLMRAQ